MKNTITVNNESAKKKINRIYQRVIGRDLL